MKIREIGAFALFSSGYWNSSQELNGIYKSARKLEIFSCCYTVHHNESCFPNQVFAENVMNTSCKEKCSTLCLRHRVFCQSQKYAGFPLAAESQFWHRILQCWKFFVQNLLIFISLNHFQPCSNVIIFYCLFRHRRSGHSLSEIIGFFFNILRIYAWFLHSRAGSTLIMKILREAHFTVSRSWSSVCAMEHSNHSLCSVSPIYSTWSLISSDEAQI